MQRSEFFPRLWGGGGTGGVLQGKARGTDGFPFLKYLAWFTAVIGRVIVVGSLPLQLAGDPVTAFGSRGASTILLVEMPLPCFFQLLTPQYNFSSARRIPMGGNNLQSLPVCLERLTPLVACLLYLILLETRIPYQPFPQALL